MKNKLYIFFLFALLTATAIAQPGANDPTFNPGDLGFGFGDGANNIVYTTALQPDGKIIIGGVFTDYNGANRNRFARLNSNGSLDNTFEVGSGANAVILSSAIQPDGKIIIGGDFTMYRLNAINRVARVKSDGSLDSNFITGAGANSIVRDLCLQPDGKIILVGSFTSYDGVGRNRIVRINSDGSLDVTFNPGSGANNNIFSVTIQPDGKILIAGAFTSYDGTNINHIARLNDDGTLDYTFNPGTGSDDIISSLSLQTDGKIIVGGDFTSYNDTLRNYIARLNTDGTLDNTFNPGTGANNSIRTTVIQPDGKILIGGDFTSYNGTGRNRIARLNSDGNIDSTFNIGTGASLLLTNLSIQPDGKIIICGSFSTYNTIERKRIARINIDGTLDISFNSSTGANTSIYTSAVQPDGKILIGGNFTAYNDLIISRFTRLNEDGTIDSTFIIGKGANNWVYQIAVQPDNKILICGSFTLFNDTVFNRIVRLNSNGSIDNTFNQVLGANAMISNIAIQQDGKIIIVGAFTSYEGTNINRIARLNSDGTLDNTFDPGTGANSTIWDIFIQPDGKIIIGGHFTTYDEINLNRIAKLNSDGTLDSTFNIGTGANNNISTITIQPDGKIIIGGTFTSYNGTSANRIARLNSDGSIDTTFIIGAGFNNWVNATNIQQDGKLIIGGFFTSYNGTGRNRIARLNSDGTIDNNFNIGTGVNDYVTNITLQHDGKIIISGPFTSYRGTLRRRIARIFAECEDVHGTDIINSCEPYTWIDGIAYNTSNYTATFRIVGGAANGCDSVVTLNLSVHPTFEFVDNEEICDGEVFTWRGNSFTLPGTYCDSLLTVHNCDSVYVLNLTVHPTFEFVDNEEICDGGIFSWRGNSYTLPGTYYDSLLTVHNCDSVYVLNLIVHPTFEFVDNEEICDGNVFIWRGNNYTLPGTYYDSLLTVHNCDSVYVLNLTVNPLPVVSISGLGVFYCDYHPSVTMTGIPVGGTFSGQGVSGNLFDPTAAGVGTWAIVYSYTDTYNCTNTDTVHVEVSDCVGIETTQKQILKLYPNPNDGQFIIELVEESNITVINSLGATVHKAFYTAGSHSLDLSYLASGVYLIKSESRDNVNVLRFVVNGR